MKERNDTGPARGVYSAWTTRGELISRIGIEGEEATMHAKLVAYECIAAAHQPSLIHPDKLTIHAGRWAFCPFDARANDHEWHDTGGADLEAMYRQFGLPMVSARSDAAHATAS